MKRALFCLFLLTLTISFGQSKVDSLVKVLPTLKEDSTKVQVYLDLSYLLLRNDLNAALDYSTKAEDLAKRLSLSRMQGAAALRKGNVYSNLSQYQLALNAYDEALLIFSELDDPKRISDVKIEIGRAAHFEGRNEVAIKEFLDAIGIANDTGDKNKEARAYNYLGSLYKVQKQYDKAIISYEKALTLVRELNFSPGISAILTNLAGVFDLQKEYDKAIVYNLEALALKREAGDKLGAARVLNNLGIVYDNLDRYDEAETYFNEALVLAREVNDTQLGTFIEFGLTETTYGKGRFEETIIRAKKVLIALDSIPSLDTEVKVYSLLSKAYKAQGDYKNAFEMADKHSLLADSLYNEQVVTITNDLESKYQNEQKAKEIEILGKDNDLQSLKLNQRLKERNAIIAFAIVALLLALLLYNQFRIKQKANKELKELDRLKSNFFANISHEFRTPLTLIKGPIEQLEQNPDEKLSMENIKMIRRNSNKVLNLVNQLLDLSRIDEGNLKLEPTEGDIFKCLRAATSSFNSHAAQRHIDYRVQIPQTVLWASFDRDKLEKIIYNLIGNAFKFTEDGAFISCNVSYVDHGLQIQIEDSGKGIPEENLPFIFDRFYQVDGSSTRENEGSGIGLSLSKDLVELMDGTVTVSSELNKGSFFTVQLPVEEIKTRSQADNTVFSETNTTENTAEPFQLSKADTREVPTVLLVEDNTDMRSFISDTLLAFYKIREATNGEMGLQEAASYPPDLIITDLMMPKMDGIELCKQLKTNLATSHIPVIMLTAKAGMENKIEGLETGADAYLTKPFDANELAVRVKKLIEQRENLRTLFSQNTLTFNPKGVTATSLDQKFLERVLALLEDRFSEPNFGITDMQDALAMSKTQLHRKLKALTNEAPGELLRNFRLKRAAQLLSQEADSVTQIAYSVGFNNLSYFAKCFKELHGVSPSSYKG